LKTGPAFARCGPDVANPRLASQQTRIADLFVRNRIPSIYAYREQVTAGGLVSHATNYYDLFRRAAALADIELVINLKTARAIGLAGAARPRSNRARSGQADNGGKFAESAIRR
jgi:hypothetical protein